MISSRRSRLASITSIAITSIAASCSAPLSFATGLGASPAPTPPSSPGPLATGASGPPAGSPAPNPRARFDRMIEIAPGPGMPTVGAVAIDWCAHADTQYATGGALARVLSDMEERGWHWEHIPKAAALLCANPGDPQYRRQAGYFIQGLVNLTGQAPATVIADLKLRMDATAWQAARARTCDRFEASAEASAEERALVTAHRELFGCGNDETPGWWVAKATEAIDHHLDRTASEPPQLLRAYHVLRCLSRQMKPEAEALAYALCGHDLRALDAGVLDRELAQDGHDAYAKVIARQTLSRVRMRGAEVEARVRALAGKDPAFQRLAFAVPDAAWKRAVERQRAHAAALARSAAYEAAFYGPSRSAARGCATQLRGDFRAYVRGTRPKTLEAVDAAATDDVGVLLLARLTACEAVDGSAQAAEVLYKLGTPARSARGPRLAVHHALVDALGELRADRPRFPLAPDDLPWVQPMALWSDAYNVASANLTAMQRSSGVVKRTRRAGDGLIVEFATESWTEDDWHCRDSNKIWKIEGGRVIYHQTCKKAGTRTVKRTAPTIWVPEAYAAKLAPGAFVELDYDLRREHGASIGIARTVYRDKSRKQLVAAYGVAL